MAKIEIDVHAHLIPVFADRLADIDGVEWRDDKIWIDGHGVGIKAIFEPESLISWMDQNDIGRALVSAPPPTYRAELPVDAARQWCHYINAGLFEICAPHSGRLIALPHLPIDHADVSAELAKKYAAQSEVGFSIGPGGVSQSVLSEPAYEPLWQALDDNACFVMIHPGACCDGRLKAFYLENLLGNPHETSVAVAHLVFANVPARYPNIKFCLSHGGGNVPILAGRWQRGYDSDRPGINKNIDAPLQMLKRFYADSIVHNPDALALSESVFGEDHILFGSDWPFPMGLIDVEDQLSGTKPEILERMFTINPKQLLASMKISA